jgi:hypothetical protein
MSFISTILPKLLEAAEGAKCVGCGYCCLTAICAYGSANNDRGGCTSLVYDGSRYRCINKAAMKQMQGTGCCCGFMNTWRDDTKFRGWVKE